MLCAQAEKGSSSKQAVKSGSPLGGSQQLHLHVASGASAQVAQVQQPLCCSLPLCVVELLSLPDTLLFLSFVLMMCLLERDLAAQAVDTVAALCVKSPLQQVLNDTAAAVLG